MRTLLVLSLLALPFVGCKEPRVVYQRVEVPIAVPCPEPPPMAWPDLPIYHLERYKTAPEQAKAWALSVEVLQAMLWQSFRVLDGYRTTTPPATPPLPKRTP